MADAWLAALLALLGLAGLATPKALAMPHGLRLKALCAVRKLEALLRRLCLVKAAAQARKTPSVQGANDVLKQGAPPLLTRIELPGLGLANHCRPAAPASSLPAPVIRRAIAPTISLAERWHPTGETISDYPFDLEPLHHSASSGPRIRSFDAPLAEDRQAVDASAGGRLKTDSLARRIGAIRTVLADPARMVRRMARWLEKRRPSQGRDYRHTPLRMGLPRLGFTPDERETVIAAHHGAGRALHRLDSS